jgi:hypothetical protein
MPTKEELITALINDDLANVERGIEEGDNWWFEQIMQDGFVGYKNMSEGELQQEYNERDLALWE